MDHMSEPKYPNLEYGSASSYSNNNSQLVSNVPTQSPISLPPPHPTIFCSASMCAYCPNCRQTIKTKTKSKATSKAWLCCCLLSLFLFLPCAFIPCCTMRRTQHICPNCRLLLGEYVS
nr:lipopolysaccharide-induced tumor necrosis factor-alpha factor homolog [Lepeophtheirus salmonis]